MFTRSLSEPNLSCEFVRKSDCDLERAVQLGEKAGIQVDSESFFRWIIYTNILRLFLDHPAIENNKDYVLLKNFIEKNSGYIRINEMEIKNLISKHGFDVATEQFKRFLSVRFGKHLEIKSERAPYFKLLTHLEEVIVRLLKSPENKVNDNSFVLFFDDLDVGFDATDEASIRSLVSLLRACRHVNNDIFGKNGIKAKAIILIRDDIESWVAGRFADTAKLFASYASRINWYQDEYAGQNKDENSLNLKKFINKRISYALHAAGMPCGDDPWASLVADDGYDKTSFKHVVNQTLFRPRDLLLFFLPLDTGKYTYPLSGQDIRALVDRYSEELAKEIKGELSSFYNATIIETIFKALGEISKSYQTYNNASLIVQDNCTGVDPNELLAYLFDRSLIGTMDNNGWYTFKCRQSAYSSAPLNIDTHQKIVVQYGIRTYLKSRRYI
jgi:hypothetical protein